MNDIKQARWTRHTGRVDAPSIRANPTWSRQAYRIPVPADGAYRAEVYSYWLADGVLEHSFPTEPGESQIGQLAMTHWRQTVERTGKFTVNFEYLDEYPEGGIYRPVPQPSWVD